MICDYIKQNAAATGQTVVVNTKLESLAASLLLKKGCTTAEIPIYQQIFKDIMETAVVHRDDASNVTDVECSFNNVAMEKFQPNPGHKLVIKVTRDLVASAEDVDVDLAAAIAASLQLDESGDHAPPPYDKPGSSF